MATAIPFPDVPVNECVVIELSIVDGSKVRPARAIFIPQISVTIEIGSEKSIVPQGSVYVGYIVEKILDQSEESSSRYVRSGVPVIIKAFQLNSSNQNIIFAENPLREIAVLRFLNPHPHIADLLYCCRDGHGFLYSVLQYYEMDLIELIHDHGPMENHEAKHFFKQITAAIAHMHRLHVVHRNISLENINSFTITENRDTCTPYSSRTYLLGDFEIAARLSTSCEDGNLMVNDDFVIGCMRYMAPEQLTRPPLINPFACDIWSLGIVLFICLTGMPLFDRANYTDAKFRLVHSSGQLKRLLRHLNIDDGHLDPLVEDLLERMLQVDPKQRVTVEEILQHPWLLAMD